ncbi:DoxX family protein [Curvibacter sp. CHRR-16]|uniref:DoxX family protein n=1 Tax=Curvibacter sp. CHRR-16 TaxID=2835872 RepID=UPI001BD9311D|nr:DoxX family protein [Curvibacter sp. CHRR-16]MBT0569574.1 DoxX family protein [Curvibacter sp. CHRR-16]
MTTTTFSAPSASKGLRIGLWVVQALLALLYVYSGLTKFFTPIPELSQMMPWTGAVPEGFVRFIGIVDFAAGLGFVLPALTRIQPQLTPLAALGSTVLQILAFSFHSYRGEFMVVPMNIVILAGSIFVLWGRYKKAPIQAR